MKSQEALSTFPVLETNRLRLREMTIEDANSLYHYYSDRFVTQYLDWSGPVSIANTNEIIQSWNLAFENKKIIPWGIALKEDDQLIGTIICMPFRGTFESDPLYPVVVGFDLARTHWNQGIMSEALEVVIAYCIGELGARRLQAEVIPENETSIRLLKKFNFKEEGLLKQYLFHEEKKVFVDVVLLSLLANES